MPPDDSSTTLRLLAGAAAHKQRTFVRLFSRQLAKVRWLVDQRFDTRLATRLDTSDVMQGVQLEAWRRFDEYLEKRPLPFSVWIRETTLQHLGELRRRHMIAKNRSVLREIRVTDRSSQTLSALFCGSDSVTQDAVARESARRVSVALSKLANQERELILLRHVEQLTNREIALYLGISENSASKRYGAALISLQKHLGQIR